MKATLEVHLKEKCESDPLIVGDISSLVLLVVSTGHHTRMCHVPPHVERERTWYCVRGVDPAVQVEHVVWNILK